MEYCYYHGYLLDDIQSYELSTEQTKLLDACIWMVDNRSTIRYTASNCGYSKSTLHLKIHSECRKLSSELYKCVCNIFKYNKRNYRRRYHGRNQR